MKGWICSSLPKSTTKKCHNLFQSFMAIYFPTANVALFRAMKSKICFYDQNFQNPLRTQSWSSCLTSSAASPCLFHKVLTIFLPETKVSIKFFDGSLWKRTGTDLIKCGVWGSNILEQEEGFREKELMGEVEGRRVCQEFSAGYYGLCAVGGMLSAGTTHLAITPLDVLKVNMQVISWSLVRLFWLSEEIMLPFCFLREWFGWNVR